MVERARNEAANGNRAIQPVAKFGRGAISEQRTVTRGNAEREGETHLQTSALRGTHQKERVSWT